MTTAFNLARLPIDATYKAADLAFWPIHFGKTVATNTFDTVFKVIGSSTEDVVPENDEHGDKLIVPNNVYDMARNHLEIATMIYYYSELRAEARKRLFRLARDKEMSVECDDPAHPSDLIVLGNALALVKKTLEVLQIPESTDPMTALQEYRTAVEQLKGLSKTYNLDEGDTEAFQSYFEIFSEPKNLVHIKSELIRYDAIIDPQFRFVFGGSEFNRNAIADMMEDSHKKGVYIYHMDDNFNSTTTDLGLIKGFQSEIVWAIVVNDVRKTITVVFRGSVNLRDWASNVQCNQVDLNLPGFTTCDAKDDETQNFGRCHEGFYDYLFAETKAGANGSTKSKGEEIIGMLRGAFFSKPQYQTYSLEVTGHSLGGALSTLFAFRCACMDDFSGRCITNVSFASPYVGNGTFRDAFGELEKAGRIRHLRISNHEDCVPLIPMCTYPLPNGLERFRHVGMNIRLYGGDDLLAPSYRRFYPKKDSLVDEVRNTVHSSLLMGLTFQILANHLCPEYHKRLTHEKTMAELKKLSLDDLYANTDITGWDDKDANE